MLVYLTMRILRAAPLRSSNMCFSCKSDAFRWCATLLRSSPPSDSMTYLDRGYRFRINDATSNDALGLRNVRWKKQTSSSSMQAALTSPGAITHNRSQVVHPRSAMERPAKDLVITACVRPGAVAKSKAANRRKKRFPHCECLDVKTNVFILALRSPSGSASRPTFAGLTSC